MDSITQFTLGAAVGEAVAGKKLGNKALLWGGLAGTIPDLDVLANLFLPELEAMAFHRGITHSIPFALLAPLPIVWLVKWIFKNTALSFQRWYWLFFLGFATHIFIDVCTTYGTQILQPFSNARFAINNIAVADPFYTIPFLLCVILCLFFARSNPWRSRINYLGIALSTSYLIFTFINLTRVNKAFENRLASADIEYTRYMNNPTILNNILWHGVAETEDGYVEGYYSLLDNQKPFEELRYYDKSWELLNGCEDARDIQLLKWFADDYFIITNNDNGYKTFNDLRFGAFWVQDSEDPVFIFNFILNQCNAYSNRNTSLDRGSLFDQLITRIKGQ